jgi:uncharacterized protein (TIGR03067 family)
MNDVKLAHPGLERLTAFAQGRLDEADLGEIHSHLAGCAECRDKVEAAADDTLVALLRKADTEPSTHEPQRPREADTIAATPQTPASPDLPADLAQHGRYRVQELLGVGGMGAVYKAEHVRMERPVALKVISHTLTSNPAMIERFRREVKTAGQLKHPNIVMAYDADQAGDSHFLAMEYVEGKSLARVVSEQGPLPVREACEYIRQAACGLAYAHQRGMVHRDIKPQNLMLTPDGQVKILDFGLARFAMEAAPAGALLAAAPPLAALSEVPGATAAAESLTQVGTVMGTPDYIAPEQAKDAHTADIRADIYSLGCTLYDLLSGHAPFAEGTVMTKVMAHIERMPQPLSEVRKDVPPDLSRVVERMMAKDSAKRYQTPADVAAALARFAAPVTRSRGRRVGAFAAAAAILIGVAGIMGYFYGATIYRIITDQGELTVEVNDPQIKLMLEQKGITIHDGVNSFQVTIGQQNLKTGHYKVEINDPRGGGAFRDQFTLTRNGKAVVKVTFAAKSETPPVANSDHKLIQGAWKAVSVDFNGTPEDQARLKDFGVEFEGENVAFHWDDIRGTGTFTLDQTKRPKHLTVVWDKKTLNNQGWNGIYSLEGDTLKVCMADTGVPRPTEFRSQAKPDTGNIVFKRVTSEDAKIAAATQVADDWLKLVNAGDYGQAWDQAAKFLQKLISKEDYAALSGPVYKSLGKLQSRTVAKRQYTKTPPIVPPGEYVVIEYKSKYENWANVVETVVPSLGPDGRWRVSQSLINYLAIPPDPQQVALVVRAGRGQLSKQEQEQLASGKLDPAVAERLAEPRSKTLIELFAKLPDSAHKQLMKQGYLKWRFAALDADWQKALRDAYQRDLDLAKKLGKEVAPTQSMQALEKCELGVALVNVLGLKESVVSWFLLFPAHPPLAVVVVGPKVEDLPAWYQAHQRDLALVRMQPYSKSIAEFAKADAGSAGPRDEDKIQGSWRGVTAKAQGEDLPEEMVKKVTIKFVGEIMDVTGSGPMKGVQGELKGGKGEFSLDPSKSPKRITVTGDAAEKFVGMRGVYEFLDGDTLRLNMGAPQEGSIVKFDTGAGLDITLRREAARPPDQALIQGTWKPVSANFQGQQLPDIFIKAVGPTITFTGNKITWKANPPGKELADSPFGKVNIEGVFDLDPTKSPKTLNMTVLGKDPKTPLGTPAPRALLCIYRLDGDTLELCGAIDPEHLEDRPAKFESLPGKWIVHMVLKRAPAVPSEESKLQGVWQAELVEEKGKTFEGKALTKDLVPTLTIEGGRAHLGRLFAGQLTREIADGPLELHKYKGATLLAIGPSATNQNRLLGIYRRLDDGRLELAYRLSPQLTAADVYPKDVFDRSDGVIYMVFKRALPVQGQPLGPPTVAGGLTMDKGRLVTSFGIGFKPITRDGITEEDGAWRIDARDKRVIRLYEVQPPLEECLVYFRAQIKSANLDGRAYLEMWSRFPHGGEFFSKDPWNFVMGTGDWKTVQVSFILQKDERPDLFKLNLNIESAGTVWIKNIELWQAPLPPTMKRPSNFLPMAENDKPGTIRAFAPNQPPITKEGVTADEKGWKIEAKEKRTVRLHDVHYTCRPDCAITYRAQMKSSDVQGKAYLEMWYHVSGEPYDNERVSKGVTMPLTSTNEWASYETSFAVPNPHQVDRIKLIVRMEGSGTVWVRDIELLRGPLVK